ncbi:MAG: hypothetical protein ACYCXW_07430 [Solirubrobacteraceae bacterium]
MTDYFDRLERELRAAVPRVAGPPGALWRARARIGRTGSWLARMRPRLATLGAVMGVGVTLAVAAVALVLLGHGQRPTTAGSSPRPKSETAISAPAHGVPLRRLLAAYAVLRRPQTAADRVWRSAASTRSVPSLTRLVRRLSNGDRLFVTVNRDLAGGFGAWIWLVPRTGQISGIETTTLRNFQPSPFLNPLPGPVFAWVAGLVPDGVSHVRWTFDCRFDSSPCESHVVSVAAQSSLAVVQEPSSWCSAGACPTVDASVWYGRDGRVISRWSASAARAPAAHARTPALPPGRTAEVLRGDGIAGARFGARQQALIRALTPLLGAPTRLHRAGGLCGVTYGPAWTGPRFAADLDTYFEHGRFSGYEYGNVNAAGSQTLLRAGTRLGTRLGLVPGLTVVQAAHLYGRAFRRSAAQGGSWSARGVGGSVFGYLLVNPRTGRILSDSNRIASIAAGKLGCPAMTP